MRAIARRSASPVERQLRFANLSFYPDQRRAIVAGRELMLRRGKAALLGALLDRAGRVIDRNLLSASLNDGGNHPASNSLEVQIHKLRQKLCEAGARIPIVSARGVGYSLPPLAGGPDG